MTHNNTTASWDVTNCTLAHRQLAVCTSYTEDEGSRNLRKAVTHPQQSNPIRNQLRNEWTQFIKPTRQDYGQIAYRSYVSDLSAWARGSIYKQIYAEFGCNVMKRTEFFVTL
jgi:hypothetical protein